MSIENENDPSQSRFAWRPATRADIGSVARFGDCEEEYVDWIYGTLKDIVSDKDNGFLFVTAEDYYNRDGEKFLYCQVQYDPNQEP